MEHIQYHQLHMPHLDEYSLLHHLQQGFLQDHPLILLSSGPVILEPPMNS